MRPPRIRFTIGRLMGVVLLAAGVLWGLLVLMPRLVGPTLAERIAEARYKQARLNREVAELAVVEFSEGVNPENVGAIKGGADLAKSNIERAIDRLEWSAKMRSKGYVSEAQSIADGLVVERAGFEADQARAQIEVLKKYEKDKQIKVLNNDVEKARADEQVKLETFQRARRSWIPAF